MRSRYFPSAFFWPLVCALGAIGSPAIVVAATDTYSINGQLSNSVNNCFNIAVSLTNTDCSYARTRIPAMATPSGPKIAGGFYPLGSIGDNINYSPTPNDGKVALGVTGSVTIDDNGTAGNPADDLISATWEIAAGAHNASTGNGDRAIERWTKWTQVMDPTPVSAATAAGAGVEYVIGSRGKPTPAPLCAAANPNDCFATENAPALQDPPGFWDTTFALANPSSVRTGIERSPGFGLFPAGPGPSPNPNVGGQTTGTFEGYACIDGPGDNDCIGSEILFGSRSDAYRNETGTAAQHPNLGNCLDGIDNDGSDGIDAADPQCVPIAPTQPTTLPPTPLLVSPPGFENVILILTTDGAGGLTAQAFWTREYIIASGPPIGSEPAGTYNTNNSWGGGRIVFTGTLPQPQPTAVDDAFNVAEDVATALNVLANDTPGNGANTLAIEGDGPLNGTIGPIAAGATSITYTPGLHFSGSDSFSYRLTDGDGDFDVATVIVTISESVPVAGNFTASSTGGAASAAIPVLNAPTVLGTGTAGEHVVTVSGEDLGGACSVFNKTVTFIPSPGFNGAGGCEFVITDADGDNDTGRLNVSVSGNAGAPRANDDIATTSGAAVQIDVLANDLGFVDPVQVGIWTQPLHGTAIVSGSPGPQAGVRITYTPIAGFTGTDRFRYVVDDDSEIDFAWVDVTILDDPDLDGIDSSVDNCSNAPNALQQDTDGDDYGNRCDADLNNSGLVNFADLALFRAAFGSSNPHADFDSNGVVNFADLALFRGMFGKAPGPSGQVP